MPITFNKTEKNKTKELKLPKISPQSGEESESTFRINNVVVSVLSRFTSKIRTNKNIELSGSAILKLPNVSSLSSTCAIGELVVSSGKLYVCSATDTWTVVGTQT